MRTPIDFTVEPYKTRREFLVMLELVAGEPETHATFWLSAERARELADELQEAANWLRPVDGL